MDKSFYEAVAMLLGTIIGAGIFGIPYVISKVGVLVGVIEILVIGFTVMLLHLYLGEVSLRTNGVHQLTGYAAKYLGRWGKRIMTFSLVIGLYGALIAYLIGEGEALHAIFGIKTLTGSLIFFLIVAVLIYKGLNVIRGWELWLGAATLLAVLLILVIAIKDVNFENMKSVNIKEIFLPYGVILFAAIGTSAIPTLREEVKKHKAYLKKAVIVGSLIPIFVYMLFAVIIVGVTGLETKEIATIRLGEVLGQHMILLGNVFVVFAMATSFLSLGLALKWVYQYDYRINKRLAWALVCFVPLIVTLLKVTTFIQVLGITGAIAGGIDGILIVLMHRRAKKLGERKPEYTVKGYNIVYLLLVLMFFGGIIYTVINSL